VAAAPGTIMITAVVTAHAHRATADLLDAEF
jgi:hypothetical protein